MREAKRKVKSKRLVRKENIRHIDNQKKDSVREVKDALYFDVQDAVQKLKSLETTHPGFQSCAMNDSKETDEEDSI
ncbi:unnamed protein product [Eruca vesicaria subsp. sativa]|uniref:Uncharacterized protein n=1 Tax=Eruca vesicaria subsp. sativa TaxID=29727 RepID=A0ABC8L967_ERUVS|nr:unnamed protein product [Eruca vesicaria subsp. sativa]